MTVFLALGQKWAVGSLNEEGAARAHAFYEIGERYGVSQK